MEHTFNVKSEDGTCAYTIDFQIPNCTCIDYIKFHWPCKHICAIFLYIPGYSFDDLPEHFSNNPFISADPHYSIKNVHSKKILTKSPVNVLEKENALQLHDIDIDNSRRAPRIFAWGGLNNFSFPLHTSKQLKLIFK